MAVEPVIADVPDAVQLFRRAFGCELTALWPGSEILTTRRNPVDGDWECLLKQKGNGDSGFAAAVLSTRVVEDADGTGHDRRGEASTPANFVEGDLRMKLWQTDSKTLASLLRQAPEPLRSMATEAGTRLQSMPDLTGQASADRLAWVYLCFDESRTVIKAVDLFVYDPDDVHFQWMRNGQGGYDLAFVAVNGEKYHF